LNLAPFFPYFIKNLIKLHPVDMIWVLLQTLVKYYLPKRFNIAGEKNMNPRSSFLLKRILKVYKKNFMTKKLN